MLVAMMDSSTTSSTPQALTPKGSPLVKKSSASPTHIKKSRAETDMRKCLGKDTREVIIKGYSCALQKDILLQGHLYATANWCCFYSNILGYETKVAFMFKDVTGILKHMTAHVIPNALCIQHKDKKYIFRTFLHRDRAFRNLTRIWQNALQADSLSAEEMKIQLYREKIQSLSPNMSARKQLLLAGTMESTSSETESSEQPSTSNRASVASDVVVFDGEKEEPDIGSTSATSVSESSVKATSNTTNIRSGLHTGETGQFKNESRNGDGGGERPLQLTGSNEESELEDDFLAKANIVQASSHEPPPINGWEDGIKKRTELASSGGTTVGTADSTDSQPQMILSHSSSARHRRWSIPQTFLRKINNLPHLITVSNFINFLIIISILMLCLSTISLLCKLSSVDPTFQALQPVCSLCFHAPPADPAESRAQENYILTSSVFRDMVETHHSSRENPNEQQEDSRNSNNHDQTQSPFS